MAMLSKWARFQLTAKNQTGPMIMTLYNKDTRVKYAG